MTSSRSGVFTVLMSLLVGCGECGACLEGSIRTPPRQSVPLPAEVAPILAGRDGGLPIDLLDARVLSVIDPATSGSHVKFGVEWQFAPAMVMLRLPGPLVVAVDDSVTVFDSSHRIPPIETDTVFCAERDAGRTPVLGDTYKLPGFPIPIELGGYDIELQRVRADLSQLRISAPDFTGFPPPPANSMNVNLRLENLEIDFRKDIFFGGTNDPGQPEFHVEATRIDVFCNALAGAAVTTTIPDGGTCGEIPVTCTTPTASVSITGLRGQLPDLGDASSYRLLVETLLRRLLTTGLQLHFADFSASALTISPGLAVSLSGTPSPDWCSHSPPPPPTAGPVRGLARIRTRTGKAEKVGSLGSVIPFDLVPEVKLDWSSPAPFLPWSAPSPTPDYKLYGSELPRPQPQLPTAFSGSAELIRRGGNTCFVEPVRTELEAVPGP